MNSFLGPVGGYCGPRAACGPGEDFFATCITFYVIGNVKNLKFFVRAYTFDTLVGLIDPFRHNVGHIRNNCCFLQSCWN